MASLAAQQTITSLMNAKKIPEIMDTFFITTPLQRILWERKKLVFSSRVLQTELITSTVGAAGGWIAEDGVMPMTFSDPISNTEYAPKLYTNSMTVTQTEKSININNPDSIANTLDVKFNILMQQIQDDFNDELYSTTAVGQAATDFKWNNLENFMQTADSTNVGGLDADAFSRWRSVNLAAATAFGTNGSPLVRSDLEDETKDVYIFKMLDKLFAQIAYKNRMGSGHGADLCVMPTFLYDLAARIIDHQQLGSPMGALMTKFGSQWFEYKGVACIPDDNITNNQADDNTGRIYAFTLGLPNKKKSIVVGGVEIGVDDGKGAGLFYAFNGDLTMRMFDPVRPSDQLVESMINATFGNLVSQDRNSMGMITGILSPQDYAVNADS